MVNIIVLLLILSILAFSVAKIVKEKKKGTKCIGCPYSNVNGGTGSCSCH